MKTQLIAAFAVALAGSVGASAGCLEYGPVKVTLSGTISAREDFGPPGYGEDPKHDSRERHLYLNLDNPVCVSARAGDDLDAAESGVDKMEMVYFSPLPFQHVWLGKHVSVTGTLFHGFSGHHWTRVLITPTETKLMTSDMKS